MSEAEANLNLPDDRVWIRNASIRSNAFTRRPSTANLISECCAPHVDHCSFADKLISCNVEGRRSYLSPRQSSRLLANDELREKRVVHILTGATDVTGNDKALNFRCAFADA